MALARNVADAHLRGEKFKVNVFTGASTGPELDGALAMAGRKRPSRVRRRQTGISDIGDFRRGNEVDRRRAQVGGIGTLAAGGNARCRQTVATIALAFRKDLEYAAHRPKVFVNSFREGAIALRSFFRQTKGNGIKFTKAAYGRWRCCGKKRLFAHIGSIKSLN